MAQRVYVLEYHTQCGDGWASALVSVHASLAGARAKLESLARFDLGFCPLAGARAKLDAEGYDKGQAMTWTPEHTKHLNRWRGVFQGENYTYTITEVELSY